MLTGIKLLNDLAKIPTYSDREASGFDIYGTSAHTVAPFGTVIVDTGIALEIQNGWEVQVRGRSGLAFNQHVLAHFGTIDSNYKGELKIKLFNFSKEPLEIKVGDRVAQGVLSPTTKASFYTVDELSASERGTGGFGHSGK